MALAVRLLFAAAVLCANVPQAAATEGQDVCHAQVPAGDHSLMQTRIEARSDPRPLGGQGGVRSGATAPRATLHLLFLGIDRLPLLETWKAWLEGAPKDSWRFYVSCKDHEACRENLPRRILGQPLQLVETARGRYCLDLLTPAVQLLQHALRTPPPAEGAVEKFVLLSDSTLPLQPFASAHEALSAFDGSDLCFYPKKKWRRATVDGVELYMPQHSEWFVLGRRHAEVMVRDWKPVRLVSATQNMGFGLSAFDVPLRSGSFLESSNNRSHISSTAFHYPGYDASKADSWGGCPDEAAVFATLYGAFEPDSEGSRSYDGLGTVTLAEPTSLDNQGRCRTFASWTLEDPIISAMMTRDPEVRVVVPRLYPSDSHPIGFSRLGRHSLDVLRASGYLFARKFEASAAGPRYSAFMFGSPMRHTGDDPT